MHRAKRWVALVWLVLTSLACMRTGSDAAPVLLTPSWGRPDSPLLRATSGALLLRQRAGAVYRLDIAARALTLSDDAAWQAATSPVVDCAQQVPAVALRYVDGRFELAGKPLQLAGARATAAVASADGRMAAIVSASGAAGSVAPALGQGHRPPFYVDIIALANGRPVRAPVKLALHPRTSAVQLCFTADNSAVVAQDILQLSLDLVVVPAVLP